MSKKQSTKATNKKTNTGTGVKLHAMPEARPQALLGKEWPESMGELKPKRAIPYKPKPDALAKMSSEDKERSGKESLVFFSVGNSKDEFLAFAGQIKAAADKVNVDPFIKDGENVEIAKGLKVKTSPNKLEFIK